MTGTVVQLPTRRGGRERDRRFFLLAGAATDTNRALLRAARGWFRRTSLIRGEQLTSHVRPGDVVLARLDVRPSFDGIEPGLWDLQTLEEERPGVTVLNSAGALLTCHDKLSTALALTAAGLPHPRTSCVESPSQLSGLAPPVVVKPRFGSWGTGVELCRTPLELKRAFRAIAKEPWFQQNGALVQELVPPIGHDLRIILAGGAVAGAVERVAAPGEWRTNVALGATRRRVDALPPAAAALAAHAAAAVGGDLVGVDLLRLPSGGWTVLELNGAADFSQPYALGGGDVYERALAQLLEPARAPSLASAVHDYLLETTGVAREAADAPATP